MWAKNKYMFKLIRKYIRIFRKSRFDYESLVRVRVSKSAILHNYETFCNVCNGKQVAPVLKSNAYGHGLIHIGKILDSKNTPFFVVDSYYEALMLRNEGIKTQILVIGYSFLKNILTNTDPGIVFTLSTPHQIREISESLKVKQMFHIKCDTGMNRQGIRYEDLEYIVSLIKANKNFCIEGICSHLADADVENSLHVERQKNVWINIVRELKNHFSHIKYFHISATAGTQYIEQFDSNVVRLGIGLYGIDPFPGRALGLVPALSVYAVVVGIKPIKRGDFVGYNATFSAEENMTIAIVPVGYYEGIDRRLSNNGFVSIRGTACPIIGRVSMNMVSVDVSRVEHVREEEEVCVISNKIGDKNSVVSMAVRCGTIPYEILVKIPERLRREVID